MAQQVSTGCYFRAFSVELCEESAVTGMFWSIVSVLICLGPWSIHRGTPRNGKRVVLRCSSDAPEGASSGIQILPPSYHRARKLSDLIMRRSAVWLGIPTVSYNVSHYFASSRVICCRWNLFRHFSYFHLPVFLVDCGNMYLGNVWKVQESKLQPGLASSGCREATNGGATTWPRSHAR